MKPLLFSLFILFSLSLMSHGMGEWETWENCRLMPSEYNDGDSFKVRKDGGSYTYILRLYFVDTPETDKGLEERMQEQADYWGISLDDLHKLGKTATKFTEDFLKDGFTVYTRKEKAMGRSVKNRYYALVEVDGLFLNDALMKEGLARFYGAQVDMPPGLPSRSRFRLRLQGSENEAKKLRKGAWGIAKANDNARTLPVVPSLFAPAPVVARDQDAALPDQFTVSYPIQVYSAVDTGKRVGILTPGMKVEILERDVGDKARVRFSSRSGKTYEALLRTVDIQQQVRSQ